MPIQNPRELFVKLLSDLRHREERSATIMQEISDAAKDPDIKEALESRIFLKAQMLSTFDRCFKLIGEQPVKVNEKLHDMLIEDFRKELAEIQSPVARHLYILAKAKHVIHMRIAEYVALTAMADITGHYGVGVLLEACLGEQLAFVERTRRLIRRLIENEVGTRLAA
jgi:ferritin-like metal-binding protein YciE